MFIIPPHILVKAAKNINVNSNPYHKKQPVDIKKEDISEEGFLNGVVETANQLISIINENNK